MEEKEFQQYLDLEFKKIIEYGKLYGFTVSGKLTCTWIDDLKKKKKIKHGGK